jgi:glycosyltransferase involved in cell wall biosynthesis
MSGPLESLRVTILVQNLPVPLDRRVWAEARSLRDAGARVSVVAHRARGQRWHETLEGIECCRYPAPPQARGAAGYALEFGWCWAFTLAWCLWLRVTRGIDVLHACNPPDTFFAIARLLRPFGTRFLFDQHDLCPELLRAKLGARAEGSRMLRALHWLELATYREASVVIAPNESYAEIARGRGGRRAERVFVVRSAPPRDGLRAPAADAPTSARTSVDRWRRGRREVVGYIGVMGRQDGVELLLRAAAHLVRARGRSELGLVLIGDGDELRALQKLAQELTIADRCEFTGRLDDLGTIAAALSACDVCACPDPQNEFNDVSSMNKIVEYMALGKPVVGFALRESARTLRDGGVLVADGKPESLGDAIVALLEDPARRAEMGRLNRERFERELCWERQVPALLQAYAVASYGRGPKPSSFSA